MPFDSLLLDIYSGRLTRYSTNSVSSSDGAEASVRSVIRTARVLKAFSEDTVPLGVNELSRRLGLSPATVHRLLTTLVLEGFVEQDIQSGKYQLGCEALFLGLACLNRKHLGTECLPVMRDLAA